MCPSSSQVLSAWIRSSRLFQYSAVLQRHLFCLHSNCFLHKQSNKPLCFDCVFTLDVQLVRREYQQIVIHSACLSRVAIKIECASCDQTLTTVQPGADCWSCREAYSNFVSSIPAEEINDFYNGAELPGIIRPRNNKV